MKDPLAVGVVERLGDLDADPGELNPLDAAALNGNLSRLRAALEHPVVTSTAVAEPLPPQPFTGGASAEELEAIEKQMKLLGYM